MALWLYNINICIHGTKRLEMWLNSPETHYSIFFSMMWCDIIQCWGCRNLVYFCIFPLILSCYFDCTLFSQKNHHKPFGMALPSEIGTLRVSLSHKELVVEPRIAAPVPTPSSHDPHPTTIFSSGPGSNPGFKMERSVKSLTLNSFVPSHCIKYSSAGWSAGQPKAKSL